jgi:hypothetical protein
MAQLTARTSLIDWGGTARIAVSLSDKMLHRADPNAKRATMTRPTKVLTDLVEFEAGANLRE